MNIFRYRAVRYSALGLWFTLLLGTYFYLFEFKAPEQFPRGVPVSVPNGKSLVEIAEELKRQNIIQSPFWFTNFLIAQKHERRVVGGEYVFSSPVNVYEVARRLAIGDFRISQIKTTIPEGSDSRDIASILKKNYPKFDEGEFIKLAQEKEGYLFPDTYFFGSDVEPKAVIETMSRTFERKIASTTVQEALKKFNKPFHEVLTMASIIEGEAKKFKTRRIIAGILWRRIELDIPLQVDVTFRYINGKGTFDLSLEDLKHKSPYNTYVHKGLPPGPISNPGIESILAAATPIATPYLYFLTGHDGAMYYAETFEQHSENKFYYLGE